MEDRIRSLWPMSQPPKSPIRLRVCPGLHKHPLFRTSPQTHESDIIFHQPPPLSLHIRFKLGVREVISSRSLSWSVEWDCGFGFRLPILQSTFILLYPLSLSNAGVRPPSPAGEQRCQATWLLAYSVFGSLKSTVSRYECGF